ncbi:MULTISPECIES: terminase gpA endonuclease subunit [Paracoccus]|uniref:terminase gpA endonuclease subunit n=1 Tax=Paracoccus TaxID=265 RepID=UPI001FCFF8F0|nr:MULTISPECIES: terminase gpA endonuclease subunit [Paracoccus]WEF25519.1 phage terminase large subunit family protein [Paracoccus sp. S3-43]
MNLAFAPERIEMWPLARLQPYAKNAKVHGPDQVAKIAASMAEFGWTVPCLVGDDGELIAGHGRVLAATQLGLTEAPVIVLGHRTVRTPYMREIMDRLSAGDTMQRIVFMKAAQVGATEAGNNWIGFAIHQAPGPMLAVQPTVELAKRNSRQRIDPLIDESPELRERVKPARSRDAGNTMLSKEFAGGILIMTGANSAVGLRSTPARYIFLDEVDAYPASADEEGDPVTLAEARSLTFAHRRKVLLVSTPTIRGLSRIEREYEVSDQRRYFVPCPHCGAMQWLKFDRLRWQKGKPETAEYHCEGCDAAITEHHKTAMLEGGEWRATATAADPTTVGYHLSALYSPIGWLSWERIVRAWDAAQGSDEAIKAFRNTILGETWVETGKAPDWRQQETNSAPSPRTGTEAVSESGFPLIGKMEALAHPQGLRWGPLQMLTRC